MGVQRRLAAAAVASGVTLTGALLGPGAPAQAVPVPVETSSTSAYNSVSPKSDSAYCPTGQIVLGGGGTISGGGGNVVLDEVIEGPFSVRVTAVEVGAYSGNWSVTAYAICGQDDDDEEEELEITYAMATTGTATSKTATAACPAGKRLYGTGFELVGGHGQVFPTVVRPDAALTKVTVRADARRGFTGEWSLVAYGTCAEPAAHMRLVTSRPAPDTATTEACPAGTHVHGVGAEISGGLGDVVLDAMAPASDALIAARASASETARTDGKWTITSYSICSS